MLRLILLLATAIPLPWQQCAKSSENNAAVAPDELLAWQLEGLTQDEIRGEVSTRGLRQCADDQLLLALLAAGAAADTVNTVRHANAPCPISPLRLRFPKPTDYLYELAGELAKGELGNALQTVAAESDKQPNNADVHLIHAHLLILFEDWISAFGESTIAVKLVPEWPYAHGQRSTICYRSQLAECAIREALAFLQLRPGDAAAYIALGHAQELLGRDHQAIEAYTNAKHLQPGYAEIYAGLGRIYGRAGEFDKAIGAFSEATRLDDNRAEYYCDLAQLYLVEGDTRREIQNWKKAKEREPERPEILLGLGNAYLAAGRYREAVQEYKELLENAPDAEDVKPQLAKALRAEGKEEEARRLDAEPTSPPAEHNSN